VVSSLGIHADGRLDDRRHLGTPCEDGADQQISGVVIIFVGHPYSPELEIFFEGHAREKTERLSEFFLQ
jgi:hypothetical protein